MIAYEIKKKKHEMESRHLHVYVHSLNAQNSEKDSDNSQLRLFKILVTSYQYLDLILVTLSACNDVIVDHSQLVFYTHTHARAHTLFVFQ